MRILVTSFGNEEHIAPVIPLFEAGTPARSGAPGEEAGPGDRHPAARAITLRTAQSVSASSGPEVSRSAEDEGNFLVANDPESAKDDASEALVRRLRSRALSVAEAISFLHGYQLRGEQIEEIIDEFRGRRYLDDVLLAGLLVTAGYERKGRGRVVLARTLAQRGIPRDVANAALDALPGDDFERALEFARAKVRSMTRLDAETAKRRLSGQLARRGYSGSLVSRVVRQALDERSSDGTSGGVRFE